MVIPTRPEQVQAEQGWTPGEPGAQEGAAR